MRCVQDFMLNQWGCIRLNSVMRCLYSQSAIPLKHVDIIKELTDCPEEEVIDCLKTNMDLQLLDAPELQHRLNKLNELELDDKSRLHRLTLAKHHPKTVRHRYLILKEFGLHQHKINTFTITKYLTLAKTKISQLKRRKLLEDSANMADTLLRFTPLSAAHVDQTFTDSNTPLQIKTYILKKLLTLVVGYPDQFKEETLLLKRLRHKSIEETLKNLDVLEHNVGLKKEKIRNNPFLLSAADAENTRKILSTFPSIAGVDIKLILNNHPKILASSIDSLIKIHKYLQESEISEEALSKCFEIFTLNCETVQSRLQECWNNSFFSVCRHHPRILELIIYQNKAKERLERLRQIKADIGVSLNTLASSEKHFNRYFESGSGRQNGMDIIYFLCQELKCDKESLRRKLEKHPYWIFSPLLTISNNIKVLLSRGFTKQQISDQIYTLLYPTKFLLEELDKVAVRRESDVCRDEFGHIAKHDELALTLYFMEQRCNFSGSAIWHKSSPSEHSP